MSEFDYSIELNKYTEVTKKLYSSTEYKHTLETSFESLKDWSIFHTLDEVKKWFVDKRKNTNMSLTEVGINELNDWSVDSQTGNISHFSKDFFIVRGLKIRVEGREASKGWDPRS